VTSLDYTVDSYNKILKTSSAQEMPLIEAELKKINTDLEKGEKVLVWKMPDINGYIANIRTIVSDLETRLEMSKFNCEKIGQLMSTWKIIPLFKRHETKSTLLQLDDKQSRIEIRFKEIRDAGHKIHNLVLVTIALFEMLRSIYETCK